MKILSIDTSADETSCAVTTGRRVISHIEYSQILTHKKWGGIVPSIAKRAHEERIDMVVEETIVKSGSKLDDIDYFAVTYGPGLAIALEVGIKKIKELAQAYNKSIIPVNHMEGHIYSCFVQNSQGNTAFDFEFPYLALLVSGGHTELVHFKNHVEYEVLGETTDDAAGEALDKAGKLLGLGYPGGPVIERLAADVKHEDRYAFPRPMMKSGNLKFSFSGLKTAFYYHLKNMSEEDKIENLKYLASSFQEAVFDSIIKKTEDAIKQTGINRLTIGGGVSANIYLRNRMRNLVKKYSGTVIFPPYKYLTGDNAAMIGVAAFYKAQKNLFIPPDAHLDRIPRLSLSNAESFLI